MTSSEKHSAERSGGAAATPAQRGGIARLAAASPRTKERAGVEYYALESRSALNRESSSAMPFAWTLNPYRGCEFGCKYCYARYTHEFLELRGSLDFERRIFSKVATPELLRRELRAFRDRGLPIALGTATDPYQPAEKQFQITRRLLDVMAGFEGLEFSITTKGVLILRDVDLLSRIAQNHCFSAHITITTTDERLARLLEPKAPPPQKRLEAVTELVRHGIRAGISLAPILPGLTDATSSLEAVIREAARARARFLHANVLFLMPSAMAQFMPFLQREFPGLAQRYRRLYARSAYLPEEYKRRMAELVRKLRKRYGLEPAGDDPPPVPRIGQLSLPLRCSVATGAPAGEAPSAAASGQCMSEEQSVFCGQRG